LMPAGSAPATITPEKPSTFDNETVDVDHCDSASKKLETEGKEADASSNIKKSDTVGLDVDSQDSGVSSRDGSIGDSTEESLREIKTVAGTSTAGSGDKNTTPGKVECVIGGKLPSEKNEIKGGTWWSNGWRTKLCRCSKCLELYKSNAVSFLIDPNDTLEAYEAKGASDGTSFETSQALMQNVLSRLDRVAQIEFLHGFNEMKEALVDHLRKIGDSGRVVTAVDIREFFSEMQATKRRRLDDIHIPDNCR